jgi:N-acetylmuramoyl-L-alanine amidase
MVKLLLGKGPKVRLGLLLVLLILGIPGEVDRRVHTAAFYVIRKNAYPATLVEGGFLTNPAEARRIMAAAYLDGLADRIYRGIVAYRGSEPGTTATAQE